MKQEHDAAERVKREVPILVILGNPPYNGFAGVAVGEERELSNAYRTTIRAAAPQGQGLNELYVRFYRMAERRIVQMKGEGVVSFISNYSWLDSLSCPGMRERYLQEFDRIWIDSLNGDKYRTGKITPDGKPDPSVFSTELNREGIQVGTAISLLVRKPHHEPTEAVQYREWWGKDKRTQILENVITGQPANPYAALVPELTLGLPFRPSSLAQGYESWPLLTQLMPISFPGVQTSRDDFVVDIDRDRLENRLNQYFDPSIPIDALKGIAGSAIQDSNQFEAAKVREYLVRRGFLPEKIVRHAYRPFDLRWLYWEPETKLLDRKRGDYFPLVFEGNIWLAAVQQNRKDFNAPVVVGRLGSRHLIERGANLFPLWLRSSPNPQLFEEDKDEGGERRSNLSEEAKQYVRDRVGLENADALFYHIVAILHAPMYAIENAGALRQDWPRIPMPLAKELLIHSADLGRQIAALLDIEIPVDGVTAGTICDPFKSIGVISHVDGKSLKPADDLKLTKNWGYRNKAGAIMPGGGKTFERDYTTDEREATERGAHRLGLSIDDAFAHLGERTCDVYLNDIAYWRNVPSRVWDYTIGGYQVIKKWLSYREIELLGRPLMTDEAREVMNIARRIAAIILTAQALDLNYQSVKNAICDWTPQKQ